MPYRLLHQQGAARRGEFATVHGTVQTPAFMNVATAAAIKGGLSAFDLKEIRAQVMLCNTYHLHLRPGDETVAALGGLHRFTGWQGPILTDSGGFQVFSLAKLRHITEEGVTFKADSIEELAKLTNDKTIETFLRSSVNMWMGNFTTVKLKCTAACRREILKKFGVNTFIIDNVDGSFNASVKVSDSLGFYQWLAAYGKNITVLEPENVRQNYIKYLRDTLDNYL